MLAEAGRNPLPVTALYLISAIVLFLFVAFIFFHNRLVTFRNRMREGWSGVEVQLKRRHDLIPRLVETVSAYRHHERETLEAVMEKRGQALSANGAIEAAGAERGLTEGLGKIIAVAEDYPDLKADTGFRDLMEELVSTENELQYARRYYNGAVREMNNAVETFPSNLAANMFGFAPGEFFEVENAAERLVPTVEMKNVP